MLPVYGRRLVATTVERKTDAEEVRSCKYRSTAMAIEVDDEYQLLVEEVKQ